MGVAMEHEYKSYTIKIEQDNSAESPREWDNLGTMVCFHRRYSLGDKHNFETPKEVQEHIKKTDAIWLPLYLYDHSGITMNTTGFSCPWDSGQVGVIFIEKEKIYKEYNVKRITQKLIDRVKKVLIGEVKTFDQFLIGDVHGYVVEDSTGNHVNSCWGYYGEEECLKEAKSIVDCECKANSIVFIKSLEEENNGGTYEK